MGQFARCNAITRKFEGGRVDHPKDPGGRTAYGIIQRVYNAWRTQNGLPLRDVFLITEPEITAIYTQNYWRPIHGDDLPPGVDLMVYDCAVNSGVSRSVKLLQAALNARGAHLSVDGIMGIATQTAVANDPDHDMLCAELAARRQGFVRGLSTYKTFGKGWSRRIATAKVQSQAWASGSVGGTIVVASYQPGKAHDLDIPQSFASVETVAGGTSAAVGTAVGGYNVASMFVDVKSQLIELYDLPGVKYALIGLTLAGTAYGVYNAYKSWKANRVLHGAETADVDDDLAAVVGTKAGAVAYHEDALGSKAGPSYEAIENAAMGTKADFASFEGEGSKAYDLDEGNGTKAQ